MADALTVLLLHWAGIISWREHKPFFPLRWILSSFFNCCFLASPRGLADFPWLIFRADSNRQGLLTVQAHRKLQWNQDHREQRIHVWVCMWNISSLSHRVFSPCAIIFYTLYHHIWLPKTADTLFRDFHLVNTSKKLLFSKINKIKTKVKYLTLLAG